MSEQSKPRRVVLDLAVSLDGFIEGPNGEVDWCIMDEEMKFMDFLESVDAVLFGRISYEMWKHQELPSDASEMDKEMENEIQKKHQYVLSRTKKESSENVTFIKGDIAQEIEKLKKQPGKDIWLYGGANVITTFVNEGLVDEFRLSVHPVVLGDGKPLFTDIKERLNLKLAGLNSYSSGVVQLIYQLDD